MTNTTIKGLLSKVAGHSGEMHVLYFVIAAGLIWGAGYWQGTRVCMGIDDTEKRQLKGDLTEKEKALIAANLAIGKVQTELVSEKEVGKKIQESNVELSTNAAALQKQYNLVANQYAQLQAFVVTQIKNGKVSTALPTEVASHKNPECGACKGSIAFGDPNPYIRCSWTDYLALKNGGTNATLDMNLGVDIQTVTLHQKPKDGTLEAVLGDVTITDGAGHVLGKGKLSDKSKVWTTPAANGDLFRRHLFTSGAIGTQGARLGLLTQKGVSPFQWGAGVVKDWKAQGLGYEILFGWQLR
jgi:hypothetical protein